MLAAVSAGATGADAASGKRGRAAVRRAAAAADFSLPRLVRGEPAMYTGSAVTSPGCEALPLRPARLQRRPSLRARGAGACQLQPVSPDPCEEGGKGSTTAETRLNPPTGHWHGPERLQHLAQSSL